MKTRGGELLPPANPVADPWMDDLEPAPPPELELEPEMDLAPEMDVELVGAENSLSGVIGDGDADVDGARSSSVNSIKK